MNGKNVAKGFVVFLILLGIGLGLYFGLYPASPAPVTPTPATPTPAPATPTPAPVTPPPNPYSAKTLSSKTKTNSIQDEIIQNTNFQLDLIQLLVSSMIVNEDSIVITTSPDAKETLSLSQLGLIVPFSKIANISETRLKKFKKVIIDDVEFNIVSEIAYDPSYPYIEFRDLDIDKIFKNLINSAYKFDNIDIKILASSKAIVNNTINFTSNEFADTNISLSFKWKDVGLYVNVGFDKNTNKVYGILPFNDLTIVINNKIIIDAEYLSDAKRPRYIKDISEEQRTLQAMYTVKKISMKESFSPGIGIF